MKTILNETHLDTLHYLITSIPGQSEPGRRKLYGAVDVMLVTLVAWLEAEGYDDECAYHCCGNLLDACNRLILLPDGTATVDNCLEDCFCCLTRLRSELVALPRAS